MELSFSEIADRLGRRMPQLCEALQLRGAVQGHVMMPLNPNRADRSPGSFVVQLGGSRAGRWDDFAIDLGGDALDLVAYLLFGDPGSKAAKSHAMRWAKRWLNLPDNPERLHGGTEKLERARVEADERRDQDRAEAALELERKRRSAFQMWLDAQKLKPGPGSPAWRYLTEARGLPLDRLARLPSAVKWTAAARHVETNRHVPALVSAMFMPIGGLVAVHRTFLEADGSGKLAAGPGVAVKKIWPAGWVGSFIPISRGPSGLPIAHAVKAGVKDTVAYAEGVEDGFAAACLAPEWRVYAVGTARNFAYQEPPACAGAVVAIRDRDPDPKVRATVDRHVRELVARCRARGLPFFESWAPAGAKDFAAVFEDAR